MSLEILWFLVVALFWTGFFVLEGFDLGVGLLHGVVGRDEAGRRAAINTIGPLWDGNEVWLIVAAAAMFAAFPAWYATMFSGFYLAVVLLLAALIVRGTSFEFRGKRDSRRWRRTWDALLTTGSVLVPLVTGVMLGSLLAGVPIDSSGEFTGGPLDMLTPYALWFGLALLLLCTLLGATYLALKTTDDLQERAEVMARRVAPVTAVVVLASVLWTHIVAGRGVIPNLLQFVAAIAVLAAWWLVRDRAGGWAFAAACVTMAATVLGLFADLYPRLMVSSTNAAYDLTVQGAASGTYALRVMTVVAAVLFPVVLLYQGWTYYVFRQRVRTDSFSPAAPTAPTAPAAPTASPRPAPVRGGAQPDGLRAGHRPAG